MNNEVDTKTQMDTILNAMIEEKNKWFVASDFQKGKNFVGYEASARMSDLKRIYPDLFEIKKVNRFRAMKIDTTKEELIKEIEKKMEIEKEIN